MEAIAIIFMALFAVSEALALIPAVKANSVFKFIYDFLKKIKPLLEDKENK